MSAISFKTLTQDDITTSRTLLHEAIPITGTLVSGTYSTTQHSDNINRESNIKTFSHGMFQSIYDYPYASSSANHIFDITAGVSTNISYYDNIATQKSKKTNIYNQMAQVLSGYDTNGNIQAFDLDGDHSGGSKFVETCFLNFSRLLVKDEIKKGSFEIKIGIGIDYDSPFSTVLTVSDSEAAENYRANSPAGEYGFLKTEGYDENLGIVYYQAGIVVLDVYEILERNGSGHHMLASGSSLNGVIVGAEDTEIDEVFKSGTIDQMADGLRNRIQNIKFNNTTELNSTIYFCRAHKGEFNYSSNPTYLTGSKIRIKEDPGTNEFQNPPMSYVTTVGLYSPDNVLLAVAKLSEPVKKTPINELNLRVRLDY